MPNDNKSESSDLSTLAQGIRRRIWVVVACLAVVVAASVALTLRAEKQYGATSSLLLRSSSAVEPQRTVETNLSLLSLPLLADRTAERLSSGLSGEEVEESVELSQEGEADILRIKATTNDPDLAARMANAYADEFLVFKEGTGTAQGGEEESNGPSTVRIVDRATPETSPVSPKPVKNVVFGALVGLVLGLGLALLLEQLDSRVKREDDLPDVTDLPTLAMIPRRKSFTAGRFGEGALSPAEAEIFLRLRANLRYFNSRRTIRSLMVTSPGVGEGKTMVSLGLALAAAMTGERVLLIEADLRDPSMAAVLRISRNLGLSGVLVDDNYHVGEATVPVAGTRIAGSAGNAHFDVLTSGPIPSNPTELLASQGMRDLLVELEASYDFVIIDSPPLLLVADAIPLVPLVGGVLAVSGVGVSSRAAVGELARDLEMMEAPTVGIVVNFASERGRSLDGYGYGRPPEMSAGGPPGGGRPGSPPQGGESPDTD